jgi:hypothetical protein
MSYIVLNGKLVKVRRNGWTGKTNVSSMIDHTVEQKSRAALKGKRGGNCNVTDCQKPGATWWNTSTRAYYCQHCAMEINRWSNHDEGFSICYTSEAEAIAQKAMFTYSNDHISQ